MTSNRARKTAVRAAQRPGESYSTANRRVDEPAPQFATKGYSTPTILVAGTTHPGSGFILHAVHAVLSDFAPGRTPFGYSRALCGSRGGGPDGGWRYETVLLDGERKPKGFTPSNDGVLETDDGRKYCAECVHAFDAEHAPPAPETKRCRACGETKPVNRFRRHKGSSDGRAGICEACRKAARRARETAKEDAEQSRWAHERQEAYKAAHEDLVAWQGDPGVTPFTCSNGHKLAPTLTGTPGSPQLSWECPCGTFSAAGLPVQLAKLRRERLAAHGVTPFQVLVPA